VFCYVADQIKDHFTCKMTRSWVLLFVLMFIVLTSQFEWNEQVENESETSSRPLILSDKEQQHIPQGKESVQVKVCFLLILVELKLLCI